MSDPSRGSSHASVGGTFSTPTASPARSGPSVSTSSVTVHQPRVTPPRIQIPETISMPNPYLSLSSTTTKTVRSTGARPSTVYCVRGNPQYAPVCWSVRRQSLVQRRGKRLQCTREEHVLRNQWCQRPRRRRGRKYPDADEGRGSRQEPGGTLLVNLF